MTAKYLAIATDGNQSIAGTMTKFIGQMEYLFLNAVKIEYNYYVKKEQAREEQAAIREQMRQEAAERKALEAEQKKIEAEESKYQKEIERVQAQMSGAAGAEADELRRRVLELESMLSDVRVKSEERRYYASPERQSRDGLHYLQSRLFRGKRVQNRHDAPSDAAGARGRTGKRERPVQFRRAQLYL